MERVQACLSLSLGISGRTTIGAGCGMITGADRGHTTFGTAITAVAKVQATALVLDQIGIR